MPHEMNVGILLPVPWWSAGYSFSEIQDDLSLLQSEIIIMEDSHLLIWIDTEFTAPTSTAFITRDHATIG